MKTLLVNPPIPKSYYNREFYLPSSLLYLASSLISNGHSPRILDFKTFQKNDLEPNREFYTSKLIETISDFRPDIIGFGCLFSGDFTTVLDFSKLTKKTYPDIPNIIGGIHPTLYSEKILRDCPSIDSIILGEGEDTIVSVCNAIENKKNLRKIDGFAFRENGKVIINPKTKYIKNIDLIPLPAYDIINIEDYSVDTSNWHNPKGLQFKTSIPLISSRSCPNHCSFCSMYHVMGPEWRARSATHVADEMQLLYERGQTHFSFMDDNLTLNKSRLLEICDQIDKRKLNIQFETPNGISIKTLDEEVLDAMVSTGLTRVSLAIESGSDYIRNKIIKKKLSQEKIYEVVELTKKYSQLQTKAFFIIGFPEETMKTLEETYEMIQKIDVDRIYLSNAIPFYGTELYRQAERDNLLVGINSGELHLNSEMYLTNYDRYFIKPYNLKLSDLKNFREKFNQFIKKH